ncbi:cAMP-binding domain of CRP or a regulatory subunit of cAMP-dependent protein kinases [Reichenbachiella faecimaris]|uniref:cAMP-binding domain of CRP or a regulatory subunit of cAMP-dependent protein kinases n=1 Tax=Reichenbachiella faecimaris TaxID=692418 RepID=A0A1W2G611_REIFA|nr:Crp/Fnr family transcriptional regulator [Reichenbachiella faecimaris]SMD32105.1 cAMP-binding domain of CRP or a regulatory subunit of cAMP-dependent protein kinases [Reichenbachiella faecimaris]
MKNNGSDILLEYGEKILSSSQITYQKDDYVFKINEPSDLIYFIEKGSVKLAKEDDSGHEVVKSILGEGSIFGEMALVEEEKRSEYARVLSNDTIIRVLVVRELLDAAKSDQSLFLRVLGLMGKKIEKLDKRIESITSKDSRTRIVEFLRELAVESGQKVGFETLIQNNFTHKDIANLTGTSRQTVTTTLNQLKEKNIINFDRRRILVRDIDLLV